MKKITLFMLTVLGLTASAQTFYFENFETGSDGAEPTTVTILNQDLCLINSPTFYTNASFMIRTDDVGSQGLAAAAQSWTVPPCQVDDWLITPQIDLSTATAVTDLSWKARTNSGFPEAYEVLISTTGNAVADFTTVLMTVPAEDEVWTSYSVNLSAHVGGNAYVAFRLISTDADVFWVDDIKIAAPASEDLELVSVDFDEKTNPITYLTNPFNFVAFCDADLTPVSLTVKNNGLNDVTSFTASFENGSSSASETFTIPALATGVSAQVTFTTLANVDTFDGYFLTAAISMTNDEELTNDSSITTLMVSAAPDTVVLGDPYYTGFEQWPDGPSDMPNAWWTSENGNLDGEEFGVTYSPTNTYDGEFALAVFGDNATANDGADDWAFSPCLFLESTKGYKITYRSKVGEDGNGGALTENINFHLCTDDNSFSQFQGIGSVSTNDLSYADVNVVTFKPNTTGNFNIGLHKNTTSASWWYWVDEFQVEEMEAPAAPSVSNTWEPCDNEVTLTFDFASENTYTVDWMDGSAVETLTSSPATHVYATTGTTYAIELTATNVVSTSPVAVSSCIASGLPSIDASFNYIQATPSIVTINFSAVQVVSCYNYDWNFGDNSAHPSSSSETHTYLASGTYTVTLFMQDPVSGDNSSISQDVVIFLDTDSDGYSNEEEIAAGSDPANSASTPLNVAINEIDFANGINVFPNPVNDVLNINFELNSVQTVEISLHSIDGKVVNAIYSTTSSVMEVMNTSKLATGIYILDITTDAGKYTTNVVVK